MHPLAKKQRDLERKLKTLERRYDKGNAHVRVYHEDLQTIQELFANQLIDRSDADDLAFKARTVYEGIEQKRKEEYELANPYVRKRYNQSWFSRVFGR